MFYIYFSLLYMIDRAFSALINSCSLFLGFLDPICLTKQSFFIQVVYIYFCPCPTPGAPEPGVYASHDEDDLLPPLPGHALRQTLCQLLQQRHEGLSGQPGWPQHWVEAFGGWVAHHTQGMQRSPVSCTMVKPTHCVAFVLRIQLNQLQTYDSFHTVFMLTVPPVSVETMKQVADRFDGPSGVENVLLSLPNRISEAMVTMFDNLQTINSKVRTHSGTDKLTETQSWRRAFTAQDTMKSGDDTTTCHHLWIYLIWNQIPLKSFFFLC